MKLAEHRRVVDHTRAFRWLIFVVERAAGTITPSVLGALTFVGGAVLVVGDAIPPMPDRLAWMSRFLPLPILEASHFVSSLTGVGLLFVSHGVARRLDAAYYLALAGVAIGIVASAFKGAGYGQPFVMVVLALPLLLGHQKFDRKAALLDFPPSRRWWIAIGAVAAGSLGLGLIMFHRVEYSRDLFWRFEFDAAASRFLRASVGVTIVILGFSLAWLLRPATPDPQIPSAGDLQDVERVIATQQATMPYLAYLCDKRLLWNAQRTGYIMYGVQGRTWVALGNPVGPAAVMKPLVRTFLERCDDFDTIPVFYEVTSEALHIYADFGFTFLQIGDEARVALDQFSLEGPERRALRVAVHRVEKEGGRFRVIPRDQVGAVLPVLKDISNEWLAERRVAEKGFSLGFYRDDYLVRCPVAVIERGGRIEAFANLWLGPSKVELSADLIRHRRTAPNGVMDALLAQLMLWGRDAGYHAFSLGMAPLSGLEASDVAPPWTKVVTFVYRHGEAFYNFQGVRTFKQKFRPEWTPRYLAYPGGLTAPRVLADVTALIAGGYRRIFSRGGQRPSIA